MANENRLNSDDLTENAFDSSSDTIIDNFDSDRNELDKLKAEVLALKMFVTEQLYLIKQTIGSPKASEYDINNDVYVKCLNDQILFLKEKNKEKNDIIKSKKIKKIQI